MKQEQASSWSVPQRQPISGLLVAIFKALRVILKAFWPLIILILFREQQKGLDTYELLLLIIPLFIILKALADFFYLRFSIADGKLFIKKGFIQKKNRLLQPGLKVKQRCKSESANQHRKQPFKAHHFQVCAFNRNENYFRCIRHRMNLPV